VYHGEIRDRYGCRLKSWPYRGADDLAHPLPLLLKPEHSSSAAGCVRLESRADVADFLAAQDKNSTPLRYCVEPCRNRILDFSVGMEISNDGTVENIQIRWLINSSRGAFRALVFGAMPDLLAARLSNWCRGRSNWGMSWRVRVSGGRFRLTA
jgi:hypothetical protein